MKQQKRFLHRILTSRKTRIVASTLPSSADRPFLPLSISPTPQTGPSNQPATKFAATNTRASPSVYSVSDGSGPTPQKPIFQSSISANPARRHGLVAVKVGMTSLWDAWGQHRPATVLQVKDNQVINCRYDVQTDSWMVKLGGFDHDPDTLHRVAYPQLSEFRKYLVHPKRCVMEFRVSPDAVVLSGTHVGVSHLVAGQFVDVQGTTKGKGVMKRHGFAGQGASHGVSLTHRSMGSTGMSTSPGRVFKGKKMPGRMGGNTVTSQSLQVLKTDAREGLIWVAGVVPGNKGAFVRVKDAIKKLQRASCFPVEDARVPYPTAEGLDSTGWEEQEAPDPTETQREFDPLLRVTGEK